MLPRPHRRRERGFVMVLVASAVLVFATIAALAIGLGMVSSARLATQNAVNSAALAAIQTWVNSPTLSNDQRYRAAIARAELVLSRSQVPGVFSGSSAWDGHLRTDWDSALDSSTGVIRFGRFYPTAPSATGTQICSEYPCMVYYPTSAQLTNTAATVNSVTINFRSPISNPILVPFANIFGNDTLRVAVDATATLVERCTAMVVDLSGSTFIETHSWQDVQYAFRLGAPLPELWVWDPTFPGGFAFPEKYTAPDGLTRPTLASLTQQRCVQSTPTAGIGDLQSLIWCNTRPNRASPPLAASTARPWDGVTLGGGYTTPSAPPFPQSSTVVHYRDDYRTMSSYYFGGGNFLVDAFVDDVYQGPEPFTSFMKGFNAALRTLQQQQNASDKATLKGFAGDIKSEIPPYLTGPSPGLLTSDLGYMIQITNLDNRGTFTRNATGSVVTRSLARSPNFIDHGLFTPVTSETRDSSTNLVEVLDKTIEDLNQTCPANAKKQIILATDGVSSCTFRTHNSATTRDSSACDWPGCARRNCPAGPSFADYLLAEQQLIGHAGYDIPGGYSGPPTLPGGIAYPSILDRLTDSQIALTVMLAGQSVEPNFKNFNDTESSSSLVPYTGPPLLPLEYLKGSALGLSALTNSSYSLDFVEARSTCTELDPNNYNPDCDQYAYSNIGRPGYLFRRPNGTLARMATLSGGLWCPLMPLDIAANYDASGTILNAARMSPVQTYSTLNIPKSTFAAQCASQAVGYNPYLLAEPFQRCANAGTISNPRC